jgi:teichuronic acid biosynthesis glycosyltransferase TuaG
MIKPQVSVIMPAFNAALYIEEAIRSVIDQTFQNWELIVINDGSTDATRVIVDRYVLKDDRIKLINQENKKLGAARNTGIINSNGEWIAFLDADDLWVPVKLEKQLQIARAYPKAGVIFSDGYIFSERINEDMPYGTVAGFFEAREMYKLEYQGNYIPVLSVLVKKKHLDEIGPQDENPSIYGCEDWDYWLRLAVNGVSFFGMEEKLFYYRKHASNMSNDNQLMTFAKATVFIKNLKKELLPSNEIKKINGFINLTVCNFLRTGKTEEALFLNDKMDHAFETNFRKISGSLIRIFKSRSYLMVRAVYKVNSLLNPVKIAR